MFYFYILYSETVDEYYKGITENPELRLWQHNNNQGRHTSNRGPWNLVYLKEFELKRHALIEEKRVKKLNRRSIELLIKK